MDESSGSTNSIELDNSLNNSIYSSKSKYFISAVFGIFALLFSQFGIFVVVGDIRIDIPWSILLPMVIAIAYGPRFGFIAGIAGGALHPFLLWGDNGWPNVMTAILLLGLYTSLGTLSSFKRATNQRLIFYKLFQIMLIFLIIMSAAYFFLFPILLKFNPPFWNNASLKYIPQGILISFIIKDSINFILLSLAAEMLLSIPVFRRLFGLNVNTSMRLNGKILVYTILTAFLIWVFFVALDYAILKSESGLYDGHFALTLLVIIWSGVLVSRVFIRYVEKRLEIEKSLKQSEEKFRAFFEGSPDAIFLADVETGLIIDANKSASEMLQKPIKQIIGIHQTTLHPPDKHHFSKETFTKQTVESDFVKRFHPVENYVVRNDGKEIPVEILASPLIINERKVIQGVFRDITERKLAQENLQIKDFAIQSSISAIGLSDLSGKLIFANKAYLKMWGYNNEKEVLGKSILDFSLSKEQVLEVMKTLMSGADYFGEGESIRTDGTKFYVQLAANLVTSSTGKPICLMASFLDVTEKKKAEEELIRAKDKAEESDFLKSSFLANMSHEIRTPMNAILGFSQLLEASDLEEEEKKEYIHFIHKRGHDLLNIINDILDISKIEANQLTIHKSQDDINLLLVEILEIFKSKDEFEVRKPVELKIGKQLIGNSFVQTDFSRVKQILLNLVGNAQKFTNEGSVEFGCSVENSKLLFYVKDTGIGIPPEKNEIVFERFRQLEENAIIRKYGGTGLGLSICKGLIDLLGGDIWFESELNKGTTVMLIWI